MEQTFVIAWKCTTTGSRGQGKTHFTREEAETLAKELNKDYPTFVHTPLNLNPEGVRI